jgi:hypothetical protein
MTDHSWFHKKGKGYFAGYGTPAGPAIRRAADVLMIHVHKYLPACFEAFRRCALMQHVLSVEVAPAYISLQHALQAAEHSQGIA